MLFYAGLTVASVLAAAVLIWVIKSMSEAGKSAYRTLSPSARNRPKTRLAHLNANLGSTPSPWGWSNQGPPTNVRTFSGGNTHHPARFEKERKEFKERTSQTLKKSNIERMMTGIDDSASVASVRNVLTGYDLQKKDPITDTSSWPYRDSLDDSASDDSGVSESTDVNTSSSKPWGW